MWYVKNVSKLQCLQIAILWNCNACKLQYLQIAILWNWNACKLRSLYSTLKMLFFTIFFLFFFPQVSCLITKEQILRCVRVCMRVHVCMYDLYTFAGIQKICRSSISFIIIIIIIIIININIIKNLTGIYLQESQNADGNLRKGKKTQADIKKKEWWKSGLRDIKTVHSN